MKIMDGTLKTEESREGLKISFLTNERSFSDRLVDWKEKPLEAKIELAKNKRSLSANAYMWILCDEIGKAIHTTKISVYREAVKEVGSFVDIAVAKKDYPALVQNWTSNGIGWIVERFDSRIDGCFRVRLYTGSSVYDTRQMSRLIDYIVDDAKEIGIDTMTPDELAKMKSEWR